MNVGELGLCNVGRRPALPEGASLDGLLPLRSPDACMYDAAPPSPLPVRNIACMVPALPLGCVVCDHVKHCN
jgi:hypothetical protein